MLWRIMRHEWRTLTADRTVWLVAALFLGIVGYGLYNGIAWTSFQEATLAEVAAAEEARIAEMRGRLVEIEAGRAQGGFNDPGNPASVGSAGVRHAVLPAAPLASFAVGQSDLHPYYVRMTTREDARALIKNGEMENPTNLLSGRFDLAFVVVFLFPLLILALSYNLLSQERENGTLAMVLSHPVALSRLVAGKVALRFLLIVGLAVGLALLGALATGALGGAGGAGRFALWAAVVAAYGVFWFAAALGINALGRTSAWNATALLGVWLALVVVAPALIHVAASTLHPVPSRVEMIQAMRVASDEANRAGSTLLAQYFEDHPEMAPMAGEPNMGDFWTRSFAVQAEVARMTAPVQEHFDRQLAGQQALVARYRYLSPAILAQEALNDISGTGTARFERFRGEVERFHAEYTGYFVPRMFQGARLGAADYDEIPRFAFEEEPAGEVAGRLWLALLGLVLPAGAVGAAAAGRLRRYPVR
jgi:ABC-2 type transport system permease protein